MATPALQHWLVKSEPEVYSIDDLARDGQTGWEGVRNYQARNHLRAMSVGDPVLFYHANAEPPGVAGVARVCRAAYPDPTQFQPGHEYQDAKSPSAEPRWVQVDLAFVAKLPSLVALQALRDDPKLEGLPVAQRGTRLSMLRVSREHFQHVLKLPGRPRR